MSTTATLTVEPAAGALGAFVTGLDLTRPLAPEELAALQGALAEHLVVFLPDQPMTLDDLERLTDELGGRDVTPFVEPIEGRPHVIRVIKEPGDELNFANAWHSDLSYLPEPPSFTLLHAWDVPPVGGDTVWANQCRALDALSAGLRATLEGLHAVHSAGMAYGTGGYLDQVKGKSSMAIAPSDEAFRQQAHPVVTRHPVTGRAALYVNPVYTTRIEGWSAAESQGLLTHLYRMGVHENLTCRLRWQRHTLAIWDNRCTQHLAVNDYSGVRRELYRTSVRGSAPGRGRPVIVTPAAEEAAARLGERTGVDHHDVAIVLGSGWGDAMSGLGEVVAEVPFADLPGFVAAGVEGHQGVVRSLRLGDLAVLAFYGRTHYYERRDPVAAAHGVRTAAAHGCRTAVLTNACGGIRDGLRPGQLVLISDHINLTGASPLVGAQFVDLTDLYSERLRGVCRDVVPGLEEGVYAGYWGPNYETPAEIRAYRTMGADLVGMSTVLEAIAARGAGMEVLGLSLVTNLAAGLGGRLDHEEVLATGRAASEAAAELLAGVLPRL